jgi:hypothetical protein
MTHLSPPNLFRFATSELSQDAVLAYLLSWADPAAGKADLHTHGAGRALLEALLARCVPPIADLPIESVAAGRQWDRIDVWCVVNGSILLIIEDKTGTAEHSEQIASFLDRAATFEWEGKPFTEIRAIYVKTREETFRSLGSKTNCGVFVRRDLLAALEPHAELANTVVREFIQHLAEIHTLANSFLVTPPHEWVWPMIQGFYTQLEHRMVKDFGDHRREMGTGKCAKRSFPCAPLGLARIPIEERHALSATRGRKQADAAACRLG